VVLLWEVAICFDKIVLTAGVARSKTVAFRSVNGRMGRGGGGGCVHVVSSSDKGWFRGQG
jgi:hypothetical protein